MDRDRLRYLVGLSKSIETRKQNKKKNQQPQPGNQRCRAEKYGSGERCTNIAPPNRAYCESCEARIPGSSFIKSSSFSDSPGMSGKTFTRSRE